MQPFFFSFFFFSGVVPLFSVFLLFECPCILHVCGAPLRFSIAISFITYKKESDVLLDNGYWWGFSCFVGKTEYLYARIMESARLAVEVLVPLSILLVVFQSLLLLLKRKKILFLWNFIARALDRLGAHKTCMCKCRCILIDVRTQCVLILFSLYPFPT